MKRILPVVISVLAIGGVLAVAVLAVAVLALPIVCCSDLEPQYLGTLVVHAQCETAEPIALWIFDCDATGDDTLWAEVQPYGSVAIGPLDQANYAIFVPDRPDIAPYYTSVHAGQTTEVILADGPNGPVFIAVTPASGCPFPEQSWPEIPALPSD